MCRIGLAAVLGFGIASALAQAAEPPAPPLAGEPAKRIILHLSSVPALDIADILRQVFPAQGPAGPQLNIVADAVSNSLVLAGAADAVEEACRLADELDSPPIMVHLEVLIGEAPVDAIKPSAAAGGQAGPETTARVVEKPEQLEILGRAQFSTLDQQPVHLQMGRREARITGTTVTPRGTSRTVEYENTGTMIGITPRVDANDRIAMEVKVEDSRLESPEDGPIISSDGDGEPVRASSVATWTLQTTVLVASGDSVTLAATVQAPNARRGRLVMLTARVERIGAMARSPRN